MIQTTISFLTVLCVSMGAICLRTLTARVAPILKIYLDENERFRKMLIKLEWSNAGRCPLCRQDWIVGHSTSANISPDSTERGNMGRRRLIERDSEVLKKYCEGFQVPVIAQKFKITMSQIHKIIRRAKDRRIPIQKTARYRLDPGSRETT